MAFEDEYRVDVLRRWGEADRPARRAWIPIDALPGHVGPSTFQDVASAMVAVERVIAEERPDAIRIVKNGVI